MAGLAAPDRLIVALDVPSTDEALALVDRLGESASLYKIGLQLFPVGGVELASTLVARQKKVFLDFKFYDIGTTVRNAVVSAAGIGASFLTVHGSGDIVAGAVAGRGNSSLKLLAVTVLTSMDEKSLKELGYEGRVSDLVLARARLALDAGADGIVASAREAELLRRELGKGFIVVTPGIRSPGVPEDDQKRISTPYDAILAGADYLVVGREITRADDPASAALRVVTQIEKALAETA